MSKRLQSPEAIAWAIQNKFGPLVGADTIIEAYAAHLRILAKIAARRRIES